MYTQKQTQMSIIEHVENADYEDELTRMCGEVFLELLCTETEAKKMRQLLLESLNRSGLALPEDTHHTHRKHHTHHTHHTPRKHSINDKVVKFVSSSEFQSILKRCMDKSGLLTSNSDEKLMVESEAIKELYSPNHPYVRLPAIIAGLKTPWDWSGVLGSK